MGWNCVLYLLQVQSRASSFILSGELQGKQMSCIFEVLSWSQKWLLKISFSHGYVEIFWSFITEAGTGKLQESFLWILVGWVPPEPVVVCWCKTKILVELCGG